MFFPLFYRRHVRYGHIGTSRLQGGKNAPGRDAAGHFPGKTGGPEGSAGRGGRTVQRPHVRPRRAAHSGNALRPGGAEREKPLRRGKTPLFHPHRFHRNRQTKPDLLHRQIRRAEIGHPGKSGDRLACAGGESVLFRADRPPEIHRPRRRGGRRADPEAPVRHRGQPADLHFRYGHRGSGQISEGRIEPDHRRPAEGDHHHHSGGTELRDSLSAGEKSGGAGGGRFRQDHHRPAPHRLSALYLSKAAAAGKHADIGPQPAVSQLYFSGAAGSGGGKRAADHLSPVCAADSGARLPQDGGFLGRNSPDALPARRGAGGPFPGHAL